MSSAAAAVAVKPFLLDCDSDTLDPLALKAIKSVANEPLTSSRILHTSKLKTTNT